MTRPLDLAPPELLGFARRVEGYAGSVRALMPGDSLAAVRNDMRLSRVAMATEVLGDRLDQSVARLADDLDGMAERTRKATDVIVDTDAANSAAIGRRLTWP